MINLDLLLKWEFGHTIWKAKKKKQIDSAVFRYRDIGVISDILGGRYLVYDFMRDAQC